MVRMMLRPYDLRSESAFRIASDLNVLRTSGSLPMKEPTLMINWGSTVPIRESGKVKILNKPEAVALAVNKYKTLTTLTSKGVVTVPFTTRQDVVLRWLSSGGIVYARTELTSSQGDGIVLIDSPDKMVDAPLYTLGIVKPLEYRVHVMDGSVIDYTQKKRRSGEEINPYIRNSSNGWVFCREEVDLPDEVAVESTAAVRSLGLDFGAVDVLYKDNTAFILEVNTAPGIEGTTLSKYKEELCRLSQQLTTGMWASSLSS